MQAHESMENSTEELEEIVHFTRVINALKSYKKRSLRKLETYQLNYNRLCDAHKKLLPNHNAVLENARTCIEQNHAVLQEVVKSCGHTFENREYEELNDPSSRTRATDFDMDKVRSILKHIVRDWTVEGKEERQQCYQPIIDQIQQHFKTSTEVKVLVPGCGLARLAWEIAKMGYDCQGNEFSFYMLFTANFILNRTPSEDDDFHQFTFHPWVHQKCNVMDWSDTLKTLKFPDVNPSSMPKESIFSMAAGDFLDVYKTKNEWDCVACCYFVDTAHNIISYIERIYSILKPGGLWLNFGPLLYHFHDLAGESSIELSYQEVISVVKSIGFEILKDERDLKSTYTNNTKSLLQYSYHCGFLVARKPST